MDFEISQVVVRGGEGGLYSGGADRVVKKIGGHLTDAIKGQKVLNAQIDEQSEKARAVMNGGGDMGWKGGGNLAACDRAEFDFGSVLCDNEFLWRQIKNLALIIVLEWFVLQGGSTAAGALGEGMNQDMIGVGDRGEGLSAMPGLAASFPAGFLAETFGGGLGVAIRGWRLTAVGTVFGQSGLEGLHSFLQIQHNGDQFMGLGVGQSRQLFMCPHGRAFYENGDLKDREKCL